MAFRIQLSNATWSYYYPKLAWASENENAAIDEALLSVVVVVYLALLGVALFLVCYLDQQLMLM